MNRLIVGGLVAVLAMLAIGLTFWVTGSAVIAEEANSPQEF